jgi:hypothetical protein
VLHSINNGRNDFLGVSYQGHVLLVGLFRKQYPDGWSRREGCVNSHLDFGQLLGCNWWSWQSVGDPSGHAPPPPHRLTLSFTFKHAKSSFECAIWPGLLDEDSSGDSSPALPRGKPFECGKENHFLDSELRLFN